jgi:hypothetical protein
VLKKTIPVVTKAQFKTTRSLEIMKPMPMTITGKPVSISTDDDSVMDSADEEDLDCPTGNSNIEKLLTLKYQPCRDLFSPSFLAENKIEPDWKAAKISGREYYEGYLLKLGYKGNIPSSYDYTVYNIQRSSSKR